MWREKVIPIDIGILQLSIVGAAINVLIQVRFALHSLRVRAYFYVCVHYPTTTRSDAPIQAAKMLFEAKGLEERPLDYAFQCMRGRYAWVPYLTKFKAGQVRE